MATPTGSRKASGSSPAWRLSGLGMELVGAIVGMGLIGWLIDRWQGTAPKATLVGAVIGILGGGYNFIRSAMKLNREAAAAYRQAHPRGSGGPGPPLADARGSLGARGSSIEVDDDEPDADRDEGDDTWDGGRSGWL